jgi:hypothetical protein
VCVRWGCGSRSRKQYDKNPRYKYDNIINMDLDMPESTTQSYQGPHMVSNVSQVGCPLRPPLQERQRWKDGLVMRLRTESVVVLLYSDRSEPSHAVSGGLRKSWEERGEVVVRVACPSQFPAGCDPYGVGRVPAVFLLGMTVRWWVSQVLGMPLDAEGEEVVISGTDAGLGSPYMQYAQDDPEVRGTALYVAPSH